MPNRFLNDLPRGVFRALIDAVVEGVLFIDARGDVVYANPAAEKMLGWSEGGAVRSNIRDIVCAPEGWNGEAEGEAAACPLRLALEREQPLPDTQMRFQRDGLDDPIHVRVSLLPVSDAPRVMALIFMDVSWNVHTLREMQEMQQQLRDLAAHTLDVREEERRRIASELHDGIGQYLTALRLDIDWLGGRLSDQAPFAARMESMSGLLRHAVDGLRNIVSDMRPRILDDLGLTAALEWLGGKWSARTGIACRVVIARPETGKVAGLPDYGNVIDTAVFRLVEECLDNVASHAGASHAIIALIANPKSLDFTVSDDGRGMPDAGTAPGGATQEQARRSFGLMGMRERVLRLKGEMRIETLAGRGVQISFHIPVPDKKAA